MYVFQLIGIHINRYMIMFVFICCGHCVKFHISVNGQLHNLPYCPKEVSKNVAGTSSE